MLDLAQISAGDAVWDLDLPGELRVRATARPHSPLLERFFAGYDRAFVLADEKEDITGFRACLALNAAMRRAYGRTHCELVAVLENADGRLLGGANFLATAMPRYPGHPALAVALNYVFVEPDARGRGLAHRLLDMVAALARRGVGAEHDAQAPAIFIEQNDPLRMSEQDYKADTALTGTDQIERLRLWQHLGARALDFPYVQPALSAGQQPEAALVYSVLGFSGGQIDPGFLHDHLQSFFAMSVLKGGEPASDPSAATQLRDLAGRAQRGEMIQLLDIGPALAMLSQPRRCWPEADSLLSLAGGRAG